MRPPKVFRAEQPQIATSLRHNALTEMIRECKRVRVRLFMSMIDLSQKTLVIFRNQEPALVVRDLINEVKTSASPNYCQRVTLCIKPCVR